MADRPILFSAPMVRALLAGCKTQTRRLMPDQSLFREGVDGPEVWAGFMGWQPIAWAFANRGACGKGVLPRFIVGDRLYVREAWRAAGWLDGTAPRHLTSNVEIRFEADPVDTDNLPLADGKFRQGMHMPRWASRLTLIVTDVRVQQLQEISEEDAIAEGLKADAVAGQRLWDAGEPHGLFASPVLAYRMIWGSLNADRGSGWDANPWIVAVTFEVKHGNIDQIGGA